jgi:hypothetical protein
LIVSARLKAVSGPPEVEQCAPKIMGRSKLLGRLQQGDNPQEEPAGGTAVKHTMIETESQVGLCPGDELVLFFVKEGDFSARAQA